MSNISQKAVPDNWRTCWTQVDVHSTDKKKKKNISQQIRCENMVYKVSLERDIYKQSHRATFKQVLPRCKLTAFSYAYLYTHTHTCARTQTHKTCMRYYHYLYTLREMVKRVMWHFALQTLPVSRLTVTSTTRLVHLPPLPLLPTST